MNFMEASTKFVGFLSIYKYSIRGSIHPHTIWGGAPYYEYSTMGTKTLFFLSKPL